MKKKIYLSVLLILAIVSTSFLVSCDDSDDGGDDVKKNYAMVGEKEDNLSHGFIDSYGEMTDGIYNHDLLLLSSGIIFDYENDDASGKGAFVYIELFTSDKDDIKAGTYTYKAFDWDNIEIEPTVMTFDYGEVVFDYEMASEEESGTSYEVTAGTVVVSKSESNYTIDIDCTVEGGMAFKGNYTGILPFYGEENNLKKTSSQKKRKI